MIDDPAIGVMKVLHLCRCCLLRPPDRDLKTPCTHLDKTEIYSDMLRECFDIEIALVSKSGICEDCISRLRDASEFKLQVQRSQTELQAQLEKALHAMDEKSTDKLEEADSDESDDSVIQISDEEPPVELVMSDDDAKSEDSIMSLSWNSAPAPPEPARPASARARDQLALACSVRLERLRDRGAPHPCPVCHATFDHEASLATHMRGHHESGTEATEEQCDDTAGVGTSKRRFICDTCKKPFATKQTLYRHQSVHTRVNPYACEACNKQFRLKSAFEYHKLVHTGMKSSVSRDKYDDTAGVRTAKTRFMCDTCKKRFATKYWLVRHIRENMCARCKICSKHFATKRNLYAHQSVHTGVKPYACDVCNQRFRLKYTLECHKAVHTQDKLPVRRVKCVVPARVRITNKRFICDTCKKPFATKYWLVRHTRENMCVSCKICSKHFASKQGLLRHQSVHTGVKPYACEECNKRFRLKSTLEYHKLVHTRKKSSVSRDKCDVPAGVGTSKRRFICDTCEKPFATKDWLVRHTRQNMCVSCKICSKHFATKRSLYTHQSVHTGVKPYACEECNKRFRVKSSLKRHKIVHTREKSSVGKDKYDVPAGVRIINNIFICDTCKKPFATKHWLVRHIRENMCARCKICSKHFATKQSLYRHQSVHTGEKPYACEVCNKRFRLKCSFRWHQLVHTQDKPSVDSKICSNETRKETCDDIDRVRPTNKRFICDTCRKQFATKYRLVRHIRESICASSKISSENATRQNLDVHQSVHTGDTPYACKVCNKQFRVKASLIYHELHHAKGNSYACELCLEQFDQLALLSEHKQQHSDTAPHTCQTCNKQFTQKNALAEHVKTHSGQMPCPSKSYLRKYELHTGEEIVRGEESNNQFISKNDLKIHKEVQEKSFTCDVCQKQFPQKKNLHQHMRVHMTRKPYSCKVCNEKFRFSSILSAHKRLHT